MISVCMTTYNGELFLKEQLDSILSQLSVCDEVIISDDGSTDRTLEIINSYDDKRIKVVFHTSKVEQKYKFGYTTRNMENALLYSSGDFIFMADQDDVWLPNKIVEMLPFLSEYDVILSDCYDVDSTLQILSESHFKMSNAKKGILHNIYTCCYLGSCMAFTREFMCKFMPIPQNVPHDLWIGIICDLRGRMVLLDKPTMLYRRHGNNVSGINNKLLFAQEHNVSAKLNKNTNSLIYKISYRFIVIKELLRFVMLNWRTV